MNKKTCNLGAVILFSALGILAPTFEAHAAPCVVPDNGSGTVTLPPTGCDYLSPSDVHMIIDGLPPGTTVVLTGIHRDFVCNRGSNGTPPGVCDFVPSPLCDQPGGSFTGGREECADSTLSLQLHGSGVLSGWNRTILLPVAFETHVAARTPGQPTQSFDTQMYRLTGQLPAGDPDFDLLRITAGTNFGLPSPGHTTLTRQGAAGAPFKVDSFFDITYRIDFIGSPGGHLPNRSGSTTATIRMQTGQTPCTPTNCDDGNPCTTDFCQASTGQCQHVAVSCDDNQICTDDFCDQATGACTHTPRNCEDGNPCTIDNCIQALVAPQCLVNDNGSGTATLPPAGCDYLSPTDVHEIINGLPSGTTIQLAAIHKDFICSGGDPTGQSVCDFPPPVPGVDCDQPGGTLGGEEECSNSNLVLSLHGSGTLLGWNKTVTVPVSFETHVGPRTPGAPTQSFDTEMFRLQGQLPPGDPDFDLLQITAGNDFNLPSPGHTTLRLQPSGQWAVDSFFDITYRIDFIGKPGGHVGGMSGSTTATIRMQTGAGVGCTHTPNNCDDGNPCTDDSCNPATGDCVHVNNTAPCDDGQVCTTGDHCAGGSCVGTQVDCNDGDPCTIDRCIQALVAPACVVPDNAGTATLPPAGCDYLSPQDVHDIINGLPAGTTIQFGAIHKNFICNSQPGKPLDCSFTPPAGLCEQSGGDLGGREECSSSTLSLNLHGTGTLSGWDRMLQIPVDFETHVGPRTPGAPFQSFDTEMYKLSGQLPPGDPDFDLLRITAGNSQGMPSPGHTTLRQQPGGSWAVDSFFDITYRIDFVGHPGGHVGGMSGSTTGTIRMQTGSGVGCIHTPNNCDDGNPCTDDACTAAAGCVHTNNTATCDDGQICTTGDHCAGGSCVGTPLNCDDNNPCTIDRCVQALTAPACNVPDTGSGTVTLPPAGCDYLSPQDVHDIINGLPAGTTIQFGAIHKDFICNQHPGAQTNCSFTPPAGLCEGPGGDLGGNKECSDSTLALTLHGTGTLSGWDRVIQMPVSFETHVGPRTVGAPVQSFDTEMYGLQGQLPPGDPDFDLLRITGGNSFGMPSPGHTTLQLQGSNWKVDSFFDITYRIDFVGHPGGRVGGMSGSTTATIRMQTGTGVGCTHTPNLCDDGNPCTDDSCDPVSGCVHVNNQAPCDDGQICTTNDHCAAGKCTGSPLNCNDNNACTADSCIQALVDSTCIVPDTGGTVTLPPAGCDYLSPSDVHQIINGLPAGTTIQFAPIHKNFICDHPQGTASICSFTPPAGLCEQPGGTLGGREECASSTLAMTLTGRGVLQGWSRNLQIPVQFETHVGPRTPGNPFQSFPTDMYRLQGQLPPGDPDFDLLRITAGTNFGLPSPGHTTLRQQPGGSWAVDSFFDITYRIDFVGHAGGHIGGMSGSTTGTIRMQTGNGVGCIHTPISCDDGIACTQDFCDTASGCGHTPGPPPAEMDNGLRVNKVGASAQIIWNMAPGATASDVVRGPLNSLPVGPGGPPESCMNNDIAGTSTSDSTALTPGSGLFFIVRGVSFCGSGPYGLQNPPPPPGGSQRVTNSCPP